jgi:hypothetical protein
MSDLDIRLAAALQADTPPARDAMFRVEVLVRLEQARFRRQVRGTLAVAAMLVVLAGVMAPDIYAWASADSQRLWFVALGVSAALCVMSLVVAVPGFRSAAQAVGRLLYP